MTKNTRKREDKPTSSTSSSSSSSSQPNSQTSDDEQASKRRRIGDEVATASSSTSSSSSQDVEKQHSRTRLQKIPKSKRNIFPGFGEHDEMPTDEEQIIDKDFINDFGDLFDDNDLS